VTHYVILRQQEGTNNIWAQTTAIEARSARSAIAKALEGDENPYSDGTFIAVPIRSWRPVTVKVETKTALRFS
jgi:hypothetical protein